MYMASYQIRKKIEKEITDYAKGRKLKCLIMELEQAQMLPQIFFFMCIILLLAANKIKRQPDAMF